MYTITAWTVKTWAALTVVVGALCLGPLCVAHGQSVSSADGPPVEFVRAWHDATGSSPAAQGKALAALRVNHQWEPHFRASLNRLTNQDLRDRLRPALVECQSRLFAWNLTRAKDWEKEFRFDMLTCLAAATDDDDQARAVGDHVLAASHRLFKEYVRLAPFGDRPPPPRHSFLVVQDFLLKELSRSDRFRRFSGDYVRVPDQHDQSPAFVHGRAGETAAGVAHNWLSLSDRQFRETGREGMSWRYSVICVGGDFATHSLNGCLLVCDGDLTLSSSNRGVPGDCNRSAVICNGDVTAAHDFEINSLSVVYAAGDFVGPKEAWRSSISIFAGGKHSSMPSPPNPADIRMKEGVKENPFGVKFVSPADAGVELDVGTKVVRLGKLTDASPLAKAGLEKGDRVVSLNGVSMETAKDFRRQLRESLVWGTGLFEVRRGDQTFLRLVKFAEPPKK